ncbi:MAG TPA: SRPBCC family protein [Acidimicrobiales bacterium]|nr:SRPBCC family protein [Acidimicrobiales bacterium]
MHKPEFVYTTYIHTTPERLWQALTDPAFTRRYWGVTFQSDWKVGSTMILDQRGVTVADPEQVVLEAEPYRRLSYTWHTFTAEWAESHGFSEEVLTRLTSERRSKVTFDVEALEHVVRLVVVHDGFDPEGLVGEMVSEGWPRVLSELKTLLETGEPLPDNAYASRQDASAPQS